MLTAIRDRAQGLLAWVIVILISVPFALWGIQEYFGGGSDPYVASVNDRDISEREFRKAFQQEWERIRSQMDPETFHRFVDETRFKNEVIERLIREESIVQASTAAGYGVSNGQVSAYIQNIPGFQKDGRFDQQKYEQLLRAKGMGPVQFEQQMRRHLLASQMEEGIRKASFVTDKELEYLVRLQGQTRDVTYLRLPVAPFREGAEAGDEEIKTFYEENTERFREPEQVSVQYLELRTEDLASDIQISEDKLRELYEERRAEFSVDEERRARHILFEVAEDADDSTVSVAKEKADAILARIRAGETLESLAKENSDDTVSAAQGGDLGYFSRGMMVDKFGEVAFSMAKGQVSDVIRSPFGFHIIELVDIREQTTRSFDEVRAELLDSYRQEEADRRFYDKADSLANLTYEHPEGLEVAAEQLGLTVKQSGFFTRDATAKSPAADSEDDAFRALLGPKITAAAFDPDVVERGNNSEVIEIRQDHLVVLRLQEHKQERIRPLDEVRDQVAAIIVEDKARQAARNEGNRIMAQAKLGNDLAGLAQAAGLEAPTQLVVDRNDQETDRRIVDAAFRMPRPTGDQSVYGHAVLANGDFAVIRLDAVKDGDVAAFGNEQSKQARKQLGLLFGNNELAGVISAVRKRADVTVRKDRL